jgi:hypothetical protein
MRVKGGVLAVVLCTALGPQTAAQPPSSSQPAKEHRQNSTRKERRLPPEVPRPHFMRNRPLIPDTLLIDKKEGWYFTLLPGIGFNPSKGVLLGGLAEVYYNGNRDDPFFRTAPYRRKIFVGGVLWFPEFLGCAAESGRALHLGQRLEAPRRKPRLTLGPR